MPKHDSTLRMQTLAHMLKQLESQLRRCARCGMCQSVCPLFACTGHEADVARGKLALLDGLAQRMFKTPEGVFDRLSRCLLCGSCAADCPSGVDVLAVFLRARAVIAGYSRLSPLKRIVFRGALARPAAFHRWMRWAAKGQRLFLKASPRSDGPPEPPAYTSPLLGQRRITPLAKIPFHRRSVPTAPEAGSSCQVAFFTGCLIDKLYPRIAEASLAVLTFHQAAVWVPSEQGCCGIPALAAGDLKTFVHLMEYHARVLTTLDYRYLVTACPTCAYTLKTVWPMMAADAAPAIRGKILHIARRVMDISRFVVHVAGPAAPPAAAETARCITYHDPCHLKKSLGVASEPRRLIRSNPAYTLQEMADADACCGMGGMFNLTHYALSLAIGKRKRDSIAATGCSAVATGCPACMVQLTDLLSRSGDPVRVCHPVEIYAEALPIKNFIRR